MARAKKSPELSLSGPTLASRFALTMSLVLVVVMLAAGAFLYVRMVAKAEAVQERTFIEAVRLQGPLLEQMHQDQRDELDEKVFGKKPPERMRVENPMAPAGAVTEKIDENIQRVDVMYGPGHQTRGTMYTYKNLVPPLLVPASAKAAAAEGLLPVILGATLAVILVGALVAYMVGRAVARPLEVIVDDIATIARGDLRHRTRVRAGGEIMLLAKSVDRMAGNLESAQAAQLELSVREREIGLAGEVREALLPQTTPKVAGYDIGALHIDCPTPGGDFHEFLELEGGRVALLVCDVSGRGIPGAMIGGIARSYLRAELARTNDIAEALHRANGQIARDVRRGMFVTALYVVLDPKDGTATVACAGHKVPLIRYAAADKKIRLLQPEGIALGLDKGPVFQRALQIQRIPVEPGDRIVIANTGSVQVRNAAGEELGEKAFYRAVLQLAPQPTADVLARLQGELEKHAAGEPFPNDISIVTLARKV